MKMNAIVLESPNTLVYKEIEKPLPGPGEALLQVKAVSVCGSDILRAFHGHAKTLPLVMGHECSGVIVEVGQGVPTELISQRVAVAPLIPCMKCSACKRGIYSSCNNYSFIGSRQNGGFAEYMAAPVENLIQLPDQVNFQVGAILEPATVALHALMRSNFTAGMKVAIFGAGSIGLCTTQWARIRGAAQIFITDISDENLSRAHNFGAHYCLNPNHGNVVSKILDISGDGVDIAFEMAGLAETLEQAVDSTRPRGSVVCMGNLPSDAGLPSSIIERTIRKEVNVMGTWMSYSKPFPGSEWIETLEALLKGELEMGVMISHCFPLSNVSVLEKLARNDFPHQKIILVP